MQCHEGIFAGHCVDVFTNEVVARVEDLFADAERPLANSPAGTRVPIEAWASRP